MTSSLPLSDAVLSAIRQSFDERDRKRAIDALSTVGREWDREAILILADGDLAALIELVELCHLDDREIPYRMDPTTWSGLPAEEMIRRRDRLGLSLPQTSAERYAAELRRQVYGFVASQLITRIDRLTDRTTLQTDLGVSGIEGNRFVRAFAEEFGVNAESFSPDDYFQPKPGENAWHDLKSLVLGSRKVEFVPITVGDLVAIAGTRHWDIGKAIATERTQSRQPRPRQV